MKKRSLVAALAMLMVSAIVLTSSTYAWFASSSKAEAAGFTASVTNNKGSLTLLATGGNALPNAQKKVSLTTNDYETLATTLIPVSLYLDDSNNVVANTVTYEEGQYKGMSPAAGNTEYLQYSFKVEYINSSTEADATIKMTPEWNTSDQQKFCYALVAVNSDEDTEIENYYFFNYSGDYVPVSEVKDVILDNGATSDIIDANDENANTNAVFADKVADNDIVNQLSGTTTMGSVDLFVAPKNATTSVELTVYVWAEGQDAQCCGSVSSFSSWLDLGFQV